MQGAVRDVVNYAETGGGTNAFYSSLIGISTENTLYGFSTSPATAPFR